MSQRGSPCCGTAFRVIGVALRVTQTWGIMCRKWFVWQAQYFWRVFGTLVFFRGTRSTLERSMVIFAAGKSLHLPGIACFCWSQWNWRAESHAFPWQARYVVIVSFCLAGEVLLGHFSWRYSARFATSKRPCRNPGTNLESETSRESATKNQKLKPANQKLKSANQKPKSHESETKNRANQKLKYRNQIQDPANQKLRIRN